MIRQFRKDAPWLVLGAVAAAQWYGGVDLMLILMAFAWGGFVALTSLS